MFYLYIIYSSSSDIYYIGHSIDPWDRLAQHNTNSGEKFTGKHFNWQLAAVFEVSTQRGEALQIERYIKKQKSRTLLEKLINPEFIPTGSLAQLVRVPHLRD